MHRRQLPLAALLVAVFAAGCGSGSATNGEQNKPAATILSDSRSAAQAAQSVHVVGSVAQGTTQSGIDLMIQTGQGAKGTLTQNGSAIQLIRTGNTVYIQASPQFYQQHGAPAAAAELLKGKWLKASATRPDLASFVTLTDPTQLFQKLLQPKGTVTKGGQQTVNGVKAITLMDSSAAARLDVSLDGKPYPIQVTGQGGHFSFSDWDKPVTVTAPSQAIDTSQLR